MYNLISNQIFNLVLNQIFGLALNQILNLELGVRSSIQSSVSPRGGEGKHKKKDI